MTKKTTILFDLDNTLIDRIYAAKKAYRMLAAKTYPDNKDKQEELFNCMYAKDDNGDVNKLKQFQEIRDQFVLPQNWVYDCANFWYEEYPKQAIAFPKSRETLTELRKRYRLGLVSNGSESAQGTKMRKVGLEDCLDMILYSGELGIDKPDPKVFLEGCKRIGCKPEEAYYVGDNPWRDIAGAWNAGITPIYIWRDDSKPCPGVRTIHQIEDLLKFL